MTTILLSKLGKTRVLLCMRKEIVFAQQKQSVPIMPVDSADILRVKNFVEIALSCTVSEINTFLHLMQKFKMAAKSGGKAIFVKGRQ